MNAFTFIYSLAVIVAFVLIAITSSKKYKKGKVQAPFEPPKKTYHPIYLLRIAEVKRRAEERGDTATIEACNNMTYKGPLPTMKPDHTFVAEGSSIIEYSIAGINFKRGISHYVGEIMGYIEAEPKNKYDPNAIAVRAFDGHHLGYIHAEETDNVRYQTNSSFPYPAWMEIEEDYDYDERRKYYRGTVYLEIPKSSPNVSPSNS